MIRAPILLAATALAATLAAGDFGPVARLATEAFPGRTHFGVVCDYGRSAEAVNDLARSLPDHANLTVIDARIPDHIAVAAAKLVLSEVEMLAILPHDALVRDGSPYATRLVGRVNQLNPSILAFGTTPEALKNGCAFALGEKTGWALMVNQGDSRVRGVLENYTIGPSSEKTSSLSGQSSVTVRVISLGR